MLGGELQFRILGSLEVTEGGSPLPLGSPKLRMPLGALLLHLGEPVSTDTLADALWGEHPPAAAATSLQTLIAEHPLREHLRRHLMVALYRAGRQADALEAYRAAREALDGLGLEPSAELQQLERAILNQDPELAPAARARTAERSRPPS